MEPGPLQDVVRHDGCGRPIPARCGIGLRAAHHREFLATRPAVPWVEVHSENFFAAGGRQAAVLEAVRQDYGLSLHGVGLSLGSTDPLSRAHLASLKRLVRDYDPALVSEHVSFSSAGGLYVNDLLPLPLTGESLGHLVSRVSEVQDYLGRRILVENVSSYFTFPGAEMPEWTFVTELARRAGCGLLLDVNNIYVNAHNHRFDALEYLRAIPGELVGEIHLAGHSVADTLLIDTHDAPVCAPVWALYGEALRQIGPVPTLIEWDADLPPLARLLEEARHADRLAG